MRTTKISFLAALLVVFSMAVMSCSSGEKEDKAQTPKAAAEGFLEAMTAGDIDGAKAFATDASAQALDMMADMGDTWEGSTYKIGNVTKDNGSASVAYSLDGEDRMLDLTEKDGSWKVEYEFMMPGEEPMEDNMMEEEGGEMESGKMEEGNKEKMLNKEEKEMKKEPTDKPTMQDDDNKMSGGGN